MLIKLKKQNTEFTWPCVYFATNDEYEYKNFMNLLDLENHLDDYVDYEKFMSGEDMEKCIGAKYSFEAMINHYQELVIEMLQNITLENFKEYSQRIKELKEGIDICNNLKQEYKFIGWKVIIDDEYKESDLESLFEIDFSNNVSKNVIMKDIKEWYQTNHYNVEVV